MTATNWIQCTTQQSSVLLKRFIIVDDLFLLHEIVSCIHFEDLLHCHALLTAGMLSRKSFTTRDATYNGGAIAGRGKLG